MIRNFLFISSFVLELILTHPVHAQSWDTDAVTITNSGLTLFTEEVSGVFPRLAREPDSYHDFRRHFSAKLDRLDGKQVDLTLVRVDGRKSAEVGVVEIDLAFRVSMLENSASISPDTDVFEEAFKRLERLAGYEVDVNFKAQRAIGPSRDFFKGSARFGLASINDQLGNSSFGFFEDAILLTDEFEILADQIPHPNTTYQRIVEESSYTGRGSFSNPESLSVHSATTHIHDILDAFELDPREDRSYFLDLATNLLEHIMKSDDPRPDLIYRISSLPTNSHYTRLAKGTRAEKFQAMALALVRSKNAKQPARGTSTSLEDLALAISRSISFPVIEDVFEESERGGFQVAAQQRLQLACRIQPTDCKKALSDFRTHHQVIDISKSMIHAALLDYMETIEMLGDWQEISGADEIDYARAIFRSTLADEWMEFSRFTQCAASLRSGKTGMRDYLDGYGTQHNWRKRLTRADEIARLSYLEATDGIDNEIDRSTKDAAVLNRNRTEVNIWLCQG